LGLGLGVASPSPSPPLGRLLVEQFLQQFLQRKLGFLLQRLLLQLERFERLDAGARPL
jgi:hypothetical protein